MRVHLERVVVVTATPHTTWTFAVLGDGEGTATTVEPTLSSDPCKVIDALAGMVEALRGVDVTGEARIDGLLQLTRQRLRNDSVLAAGASLHRFLGAGHTDAIELYANINRGLRATDRTPDDFERAAGHAAREGFRTLKCAPFDEGSLASPVNRMLREALPGLARVRAVRRAIGADARLLVDCHSRFSAEAAPAVARELATLDVAGSRSRCNRHRRPPTWPRSGRSAVGRGGGVSLHSPSGPVSLLASAHVTAAVDGAMPLEHAVHEVGWRADLIEPAERIEGGRLLLPSTAASGMP